MNYRKRLAKKIHMSPCSFWHTKQFCHIFTPVSQLLSSILHKNGPTTYNEHFTAYSIMAFVSAGWLHEMQWVLCTAFWSMDMTGVYACLFEAVCDVTTVPSHLNTTVILQIFSVVLFSVISVVNGFTEIKKTPKTIKVHWVITAASTNTEI